MKKFFLILLLAVCPLCAKAQIATYDASNFMQLLLSYIRDGESNAENAALFLENIGISKEMLTSMKEWNDRYREFSNAVSKGKTAIDIASTYKQTYEDFVYMIARFRTVKDYSEAQRCINDAWYYLLLSSSEVKKCREYLKKDIAMTDGERLQALQASEKRMKRILAGLTRYMASTFELMDAKEQAAMNMAGLESAFEMQY